MSEAVEDSSDQGAAAESSAAADRVLAQDGDKSAVDADGAVAAHGAADGAGAVAAAEAVAAGGAAAAHGAADAAGAAAAGSDVAAVDRAAFASASSAAAVPAPLDSSLRELNALWRGIDELYRDVCFSMGLSDSSFDILYTLYMSGDGCLQRDICDQIYLGKQTVNTSIHKLEGQGYLVLKKAPRGRGKLVYLTDAGRELVARCVAPVAQAEQVALESLDAEERRRAFDFFGAYIAVLRENFSKIPGVRMTPHAGADASEAVPARGAPSPEASAAASNPTPPPEASALVPSRGGPVA